MRRLPEKCARRPTGGSSSARTTCGTLASLRGRDGGYQIPTLVEDARQGRAGATSAMVPLLYAELRRMARGLMRRERPGVTLQTADLLHEACLRLLGGDAEWESRAHFMGAAALAMRRVLIEGARRRLRLKRGGERERVTLTDGAAQVAVRPEELMSLDAALLELQRHDADMARVVELRYFGGLTVEEAALVLGTSVRSVHRQWAGARAWLHRALASGPPPGR
jgi:RNA polymerase sigma factor (TIGR02999 family)